MHAAEYRMKGGIENGNVIINSLIDCAAACAAARSFLGILATGLMLGFDEQNNNAEKPVRID
jgi:hypothetical protein